MLTQWNEVFSAGFRKRVILILYHAAPCSPSEKCLLPLRTKKCLVFDLWYVEPYLLQTKKQGDTISNDEIIRNSIRRRKATGTVSKEAPRRQSHATVRYQCSRGIRLHRSRHNIRRGKATQLKRIKWRSKATQYQTKQQCVKAKRHHIRRSSKATKSRYGTNAVGEAVFIGVGVRDAATAHARRRLIGIFWALISDYESWKSSIACSMFFWNEVGWN